MTSPTIQTAQEELDDELSVILANSFLSIWNHNWFHGVSSPVQRLPQQASQSSPSRSPSTLSAPQAARRSFYQFLIKLTRGVGGDVHIATIPSPKDPASEVVVAILLWCPPYKRNGSGLGPELLKDTWILYKAGVLNTIRGYGISAFSRISDTYEGNVQRMFKESLVPRGFKPEECGFVQMTAVNFDPELEAVVKGQGYARQLLQWRVEKHWEECKNPKTGTSGRLTPVILDTSTEQGIRAYRQLGFELVNQHVLDTKVDKNGFKLSKDLSKQEKAEVAAEARKESIIRIMIKMPPQASIG